ncbi:uncharacterized protein LOC103673825 isoform X3 [Ursus maritimus]|nr:uncharacterized protein LOC103673825 isoform X3 [Ursus maritimus]
MSQQAREHQLQRKAVVLEYSTRRKRKEKKKKSKGLSARQRRELRLFDIKPEQQRYSLFLPLHELWKQYIRDLCGGLKPDTHEIQMPLLCGCYRNPSTGNKARLQSPHQRRPPESTDCRCLLTVRPTPAGDTPCPHRSPKGSSEPSQQPQPDTTEGRAAWLRLQILGSVSVPEALPCPKAAAPRGVDRTDKGARVVPVPGVPGSCPFC